MSRCRLCGHSIFTCSRWLLCCCALSSRRTANGTLLYTLGDAVHQGEHFQFTKDGRAIVLTYIDKASQTERCLPPQWRVNSLALFALPPLHRVWWCQCVKKNNLGLNFENVGPAAIRPGSAQDDDCDSYAETREECCAVVAGHAE